LREDEPYQNLAKNLLAYIVHEYGWYPRIGGVITTGKAGGLI